MKLSALKYSDSDSSGSKSLSSEHHANESELTGSVGELEGSGDGVTSADGGSVTLVDGGSVTSVDGGSVTSVDRCYFCSVEPLLKPVFALVYSWLWQLGKILQH